MAGLLVSVRSVAEARAAVRGGAAVIDIKEPAMGPLGRAPCSTWQAIRAVVPPEVPVSVALGELADFEPETIQPAALAGISYRKVGPAGLGPDWSRRWTQTRQADSVATGWVAVAYADWQKAGAPDPADVIATALEAENCPGFLLDTWDKSARCPLVALELWQDRIHRIQASGRFVALAGRLDLAEIARLLPLAPDLFAVRGAACAGGHREGQIDPTLVAHLVAAAAQISRKNS